MLDDLPSYIAILFFITTLTTLLLFYWAIKNSSSEKIRSEANMILFGLITWLTIQALLSIEDIYNTDLTSMPPNILLFGVLPAMVTVIFIFLTRNGKRFVDSLPLSNVTYVNIIRIPVEIVLFCLFLNKAVPQLMTFAGKNFDILAGISAPFIAYYGLTKNKLSKGVVLTWNFISLALLLNIVTHAVLSAPFPFQQLAFDQPNIAILNFPFSWLPTFVVPIIFFGHLISIRQLTVKPKNEDD